MSWWLLSDAVFVFPDTQPLSLGGGQSRTSWITIRVNVKTLTELKVNV